MRRHCGCGVVVCVGDYEQDKYVSTDSLKHVVTAFYRKRFRPGDQDPEAEIIKRLTQLVVVAQSQQKLNVSCEEMTFNYRFYLQMKYIHSVKNLKKKKPFPVPSFHLEGSGVTVTLVRKRAY